MKQHIEKLRHYLEDVPVISKLLHRGPRVAVIRLSGIIADTARTKTNISYNKFYALIEKAFNRADTAVVLAINSPGGSAAQSSLIAGHVRRLAQEKKLSVYAFVEDVAASGGYWLACAADEIYAQEVSIVGSIGVISAGFGFQDLIERHGVERRVHTSGKNKGFLDPFQPEKAEDVERLKAIQKDIHAAFITWVKSRRAAKLYGTDKDLFEGQFWTGQAGVEKGLIDGIAEASSFLREKYGEKVKLIPIAPEKKFLPSLLPFNAGLGDDIAETLASRGLWSRYGL